VCQAPETTTRPLERGTRCTRGPLPCGTVAAVSKRVPEFFVKEANVNQLRLQSMRRVAPIPMMLLAMTLLLTVTASSAVALPFGFTAFGGIYSGGVDEAFVGGGARLGMGGLGITTYLEYLFVDNGTAYTINVDGTMPIIPLGIASLYGGIGAGLLVTDTDFTDSNTETVGNLIVGAGFNATRLKPFGQIKYVFVEGDDPLVFSAGIRF
jgi:hypothetical protein